MLSQVIRRRFGAQIPYEGIERWNILHKNIKYNPSVPQLYEEAVKSPLPADFHTRPTTISSTGALVAYSGQRYGRSPADKRIVEDDMTKKDVWWGPVNFPISTDYNRFSRDLAVKYLNTRRNLFVVDGYAGWDPAYRLKVRVLCTRPYHALFMKNMLIRPTDEELKRDFVHDKNIDFHIFNAGELLAPQPIPGTSSPTSVQVNFSDRTLTILGTQYAGEMKKGVFGVMHYFMPKKGVVSLHASATEGNKGDVTLYFGLSGTGKTTLSADPKRKMLGDDEHCWSDSGVFNIEGGCYAKCVSLTEEKEPDIYRAIKFGAIMENVLFEPGKEAERVVNYEDISITENTRVSYPLEHIPNAKFPSLGGHAKNLIFLTCDAFGVLPPIAKLTPGQTMYHFISGYTAKVAGTEMGIKDPVPTFSSCFGAAFLPLHPTLYAEMLAEKIKKYKAQAWLINTGWTGGKYGVGKRMSLKVTRAIIDSIHDGSVDQAEWVDFPVFGFKIPKSLPNVPADILMPRNTWTNKDQYDGTLATLGTQFAKNFAQYKDKASAETRAGGPN